MNRPLPIALLAALVLPAATAAQQASDRFDAARFTPAPVTAPLPLDAAPRDARSAAVTSVEATGVADAREARSFLGKALHLVGAAVVGGWVGYVGSQVALSDWEKETNSSFNDERSAWVAGGMVVGILGIRLIGGTTAPGRPVLEPHRPRGGRNVLNREEIITSGARSVFDLVSTERREWLVTRGTNSFRESPRGSGSGTGSGATLTVAPGKATLVVYMDDIRLGGVEEMRNIMINDIMEIRFIEPREAVVRYGSGHTHGVILLKTILQD